VVGVPDTRWGERPLALVVPVVGAELEPVSVQQHLAQFVESGAISKWAVPEQFRIVDEIPKTSVGKVNKKQIREQLPDV
jgi:fatty-acyl-CoA synthase